LKPRSASTASLNSPSPEATSPYREVAPPNTQKAGEPRASRNDRPASTASSILPVDLVAPPDSRRNISTAGATNKTNANAILDQASRQPALRARPPTIVNAPAKKTLKSTE